jgi:hypothetical protein
MQYKLSKNQWLQIGTQAGWIKEADVITHETGREGFGESRSYESEETVASASFHTENVPDQMKKWIVHHVNKKRMESGNDVQVSEGDIQTVYGDINIKKQFQSKYIPGGTRHGIDAGQLDYAEEKVEGWHTPKEEKGMTGAATVEASMKDGSKYSLTLQVQGDMGNMIGSGTTDPAKLFEALTLKGGNTYTQEIEAPSESTSAAPQDKRSIWSRIFGRKASAEDYRTALGWTPKNSET